MVFVFFPLLSAAASLMPKRAVTGCPSRVRSTAEGGLPLMGVLAWIRHHSANGLGNRSGKNPPAFCMCEAHLRRGGRRPLIAPQASAQRADSDFLVRQFRIGQTFPLSPLPQLSVNLFVKSLSVLGGWQCSMNKSGKGVAMFNAKGWQCSVDKSRYPVVSMDKSTRCADMER